MIDFIIWVVIFVIMVIVEAATMQLVSIWFVFGAACAFVSAFFLPFGWQLSVFIIVSALLLIFTRPLLKKFKQPFTATNYEKEIGSKAVVIEKIDADGNTGRVRLNGVDWRASSESGRVVEEGETVTVTKIQGTCLVVSSEEKNNIN